MFGDCPLKAGWGQRIMPPDEMRWTWIFHQTEGAPVTKGLELMPGSSALNRATREIASAKATYRACLEKYGTEQWISDAPIAELTEANLPAWAELIQDKLAESSRRFVQAGRGAAADRAPYVPPHGDRREVLAEALNQVGRKNHALMFAAVAYGQQR